MVVLPSEDGMNSDRNWPKDDFGRKEVIAQLFQFAPLIMAFLAGGLMFVRAFFLAKPAAEVIVYCAQDQTYAEPIFRDFQRETGIKVRAVYDNEAVKTVGLANRLLAERNHPQCDLFWGNEEMRTRQLAAQNIFRETNGWTS